MATYTTNLNLKKPAQSDKIRIADINNNMDDIDGAFGAIGNDSVATQIGDLQGALAIVATGDSHAAISAGQYVYVKSHSTLDTGLYVASTNIAQNGALSSSNLTADTSGGLNALNSNLTATNNRTLTKRYYSSYTVNSTNVSWSWSTGYLQLVGDVLFLSTGITPSATSNDWLNILTVQSDYKPTYEVRCVATAEDGSETRVVRITTDGKIDILKPNTKAYWFEIIWLRNISN